MREVYKNCGYVLDPHGAVGFCALRKYLERHPDKRGFFLETAHAVKFDSVEKIIGCSVAAPEAVKDLFSRPKRSVEMNVNYEDLKEILLTKF